jgi:hypothetical protein
MGINLSVVMSKDTWLAQLCRTCDTKAGRFFPINIQIYLSGLMKDLTR